MKNYNNLNGNKCQYCGITNYTLPHECYLKRQNEQNEELFNCDDYSKTTFTINNSSYVKKEIYNYMENNLNEKLKQKDLKILELEISLEIYKAIESFENRKYKLSAEDVAKDYYDIPINNAVKNIIRIFESK